MARLVSKLAKKESPTTPLTEEQYCAQKGCVHPTPLAHLSVQAGSLGMPDDDRYYGAVATMTFAEQTNFFETFIRSKGGVPDHKYRKPEWGPAPLRHPDWRAGGEDKERAGKRSSL